MKIAIRMIAGAVLFAAALLLSSWLLKGKATGEWVNAALYIGLACFLLSQMVFVLQSSQKQ